MAYVKRFEELFKQEKEKVEGEAYHGSKAPVNRFTNKLISTKGDLPGIHLTSDENAARLDGGPYVVKADVMLKKVIQTEATRKMKRPDALYMVNEAPGQDEEGRNDEFRSVDSIMNSRSQFEGFREIYKKFYRGHEEKFVENMSKLGYDAAVTDGKKGVKNYIVFNAKALKIKGS